MENATRALLIAAGVFFGLMILTMLLFGYRQITDYYTTIETEKRIEQITKFNQQYEIYNKKDVRGNDILTLINKIIDYNKRESEADGIKFERMLIEVEFDGRETEFRYNKNTDYSTGASDIIKNFNSDNISIISDALNEIIVNTEYINKESQLQKLTTNISNIFAPDDYANKNSNDSKYLDLCAKRNSIVKNVIGEKYDDIGSSNQKKLKKAILEYYQYQRFKRAHFDCTGTEYNVNTGRIVKLTFKFNGKFE